MSTWREDFDAWKAFADAYGLHSLDDLSDRFGIPIPESPSFSFETIPVPLSPENQDTLAEEVQKLWDVEFAPNGYENSPRYGVFGIDDNLWLITDGLRFEAWATDYATSRFANRDDKEVLWATLNENQRSYLE